MDWSEATFAIFVVFCTVIVTILAVALHYIKKIVNWLFSPVTTRTSRRS